MYMIIPDEHAPVGTSLIIHIGNRKFIYPREYAKGKIDEKRYGFSALMKTQIEKGLELMRRLPWIFFREETPAFET